MPRAQKSKAVNRPKCNCHLWDLIGSYYCPVHGNQNLYRQTFEAQEKEQAESGESEVERWNTNHCSN